ncbi:TadE/TadG family type IV pilus assembly protein [Massilia sp. TWP1-3-3]|uniref:TadE/TadG family type IV pilus assembly protein n=1 Tax=Massilia sp. TWP1-3-3 TaxID=2804573 RepID=UPI003CF1C5BF
MTDTLHLTGKRLPPGDKPVSRRRQAGVAAIEFGIILPVLLLLLALPIFISRVLMHYSVAQKAAHDAALYLARVPAYEVWNQSMFGANVAIAKEIATIELAELRPGMDSPVYVGVSCNGFPCGPQQPKNIRVTVQMLMFDEFFSDSTWRIVGDQGVLVTAEMNVPYVGSPTTQ